MTDRATAGIVTTAETVFDRYRENWKMRFGKISAVLLGVAGATFCIALLSKPG
ncbi:MAG: hypothetical protein ACYSWW_15480 [Planctomycetota bacterium]